MKNSERSRNNITLGEKLIDIELFAGGGGMAVGLRNAGFSPSHFYEADDICCSTLKANLDGRKPTISGKVVNVKTEEVNWKPFRGKVRLLAGGAPCQPFSLGGTHYAHKDHRNLFPEVLRAVRETRPAAIMLENVRGILRTSFRPYFDYILLQLQFPSIEPLPSEKWISHNKRLKIISAAETPEYEVNFKLYDAADFGVPQNRFRVFIIATKAGLSNYSFPKKSHSKEALEIALAGKDYWARHSIRRPPDLISNGRLNLIEDSMLPWVTVRDALTGLPAPANCEHEAHLNHWMIHGARPYVGHTGSTMDWPAKTIKAGVHGVPGGENAVTDSTGIFRYFTLREAARIQTFPDHHAFAGTRIRVTRQIGNAVPSKLVTAIATPLFALLSAETKEARI